MWGGEYGTDFRGAKTFVCAPRKSEEGVAVHLSFADLRGGRSPEGGQVL